jgi:hypothetical protein
MSAWKNLSDIYTDNVIRGQREGAPRRYNLSGVYKNMFLEDTQQELEGIAPGSGGDESRVAVFHIPTHMLTDEIVAQFRELGGDGPVHIPASYFSKVERRFRGKTIESYAHEWLAVSTKGKIDSVTYESLLNKLFDNDLKGAEDLREFRQFIDWKKGSDAVSIQDTVYDILSSDMASDINFIQELTPVVNYFIASDPEQLIRDFWKITEQSKRVGIGKGEMAISLLTRGFKGEPGDVKYKLTDDNNELSIEVKGRGGRPGGGNHAHSLSKTLEKIVKKYKKTLSTAEIDDIQYTLYGSTITKKWEDVRNWFNTTFKNRPIISANSGTTENSSRDVIQYFLEKMDKIVNTQSSKDSKAVVNQFKNELSVLEEWLRGIAKKIESNPDLADADKRKFLNQTQLPSHIYTALSKDTSAGVAFYVANRNSLRDVENILNIGTWGRMVTVFFNWFAKNAELSDVDLAKALVNTRSDKIPKYADDLEDAIYTLLQNQGREIVYDKDSLSKLIAAIQFTGYCCHDGFNRALFINDANDVGTLNGRVVPTYQDDPATTLNDIYNEFITNNYNIDMGLDDKNKGIQITYEG